MLLREMGTSPRTWSAPASQQPPDFTKSPLPRVDHDKEMCWYTTIPRTEKSWRSESNKNVRRITSRERVTLTAKHQRARTEHAFIGTPRKVRTQQVKGCRRLAVIIRQRGRLTGQDLDVVSPNDRTMPRRSVDRSVGHPQRQFLPSPTAADPALNVGGARARRASRQRYHLCGSGCAVRRCARKTRSRARKTLKRCCLLLLLCTSVDL